MIPNTFDKNQVEKLIAKGLFVPSFLNSSDLNFAFYHLSNALYVQIDGVAHRVLEVSLGKKRKIDDIDNRAISIKFLQSEEEIVGAKWPFFEAKKAEVFISKLAKNHCHVNLNVEDAGRLQTRVSLNPAFPKSKMEKYNLPKKEKEGEESKDPSLWSGLFRPYMQMALQICGMLTLMLLLVGAFPLWANSFVFLGGLAAMWFPGQILTVGEKIVKIFTKSSKKAVSAIDHTTQAIMYHFDQKDVWATKKSSLSAKQKFTQKRQAKAILKNEFAARKQQEKSKKTALRRARIKRFLATIHPPKTPIAPEMELSL